MPHPLTYGDNRSYEPAELAELRVIFDEVWASLATEPLGPGTGFDEARGRLGQIIFDLAKDRQLDPLQMARTAARLVREAFAPEPVA